MEITPDQLVYFKHGFVVINATIVSTWVVMALLVLVSWLVTRNMSEDVTSSRWQNMLEAVVGGIRDQIADISGDPTGRYVPFVGTLFLFLFSSTLLSIVPQFHPPSASLSTTAALAICVFFAVPMFGIVGEGVAGYLKHYVQPTFLMLPFHIIGELSRTLALAVRLFGNIMSGSLISAILLSIVPLIFPLFTDALGFLTGVIQSYIFAVLAVVYISSASRVHRQRHQTMAVKG